MSATNIIVLTDRELKIVQVAVERLMSASARHLDEPGAVTTFNQCDYLTDKLITEVVSL